MAVNLLMILKPALFGIPGAEWASRISFLTVAIWWALFSIPIFKYVPEIPAVISKNESPNPLLAGYQRLSRTFRDIRKFKELIKFLAAFWLYNDGVGTIIIMAVIFGTEIGIGKVHLIGAILMVQFLGVPCSVIFGRLPKRMGIKNSIITALCIYTIISFLGYFMEKPAHFWLLAFLVSMVQGGTQALSRSLFGSMVPPSKSAEFFGFYNVSSKFAGIFGPALFGFIGQLTGSSRVGIVTIVFFFLTGAILLRRTDIVKGRKEAKEEEAILRVESKAHEV